MKTITIDVSFANVAKRNGGPYRDTYGCDATFASTAPEVQTNGDIDLSQVDDEVEITFVLQTTSFPMNQQNYNCSYPAQRNESFWIGRRNGPPPQKGNAPPFKDVPGPNGPFTVGRGSDGTHAILFDENDDGEGYKYCMVIDFQLGAATKSIVIDPVIINRQPDQEE